MVVVFGRAITGAVMGRANGVGGLDEVVDVDLMLALSAFLLSAECVALAGSPSIVSGGSWWTSPAPVLVQPDPITSSALQLSLNTLIDFLSHCMDPVVRVTGRCIKRKTFDWCCFLNLSSS